tara:strand:- start:7 stop:255 length:249 start_codon:yes stop_codon:yes gene_type:complete
MEEKIKEIVRLSLLKNNWGIYFKAAPLLELPVNGSSPCYQINDVSISELEGAISNQIISMFDTINEEGDAQCKERKESSEEE